MLHARITFPAQPGPMTLYFPKWIPGTHRIEGPIQDLAGLSFTAGGKSIPWQRDTLDYYTLHCNVPAGARALEVQLDALNVPAGTDIGYSTGSPSCSTRRARPCRSSTTRRR
jgi:hypothetical protein